MNARFWKLSHGAAEFPYHEFLELMERHVVCVHKGTGPKGMSTSSQGEDFENVQMGDYFYLTYGNQGIFLLGQFIGPANIISARGNGWVEREYKVMRTSRTQDVYTGPEKWWTPNHNSTFVQVPPGEFAIFEKHILFPYFELLLINYGVVA